MIRRIVLVITGVVLFAAIVGTAVSYSFAGNGPYLPGDKLFPQQLTSEQVWKVRLMRSLVPRADSVLDLFERRIDNLEAVQGSAHELGALQYLEAAFDQAVLAIAAVPEPDRPPLQERLRLLTERAVALIGTLDIVESDEGETAVSALIGKLETLLLILEESGDNPVEIADVAAIETELIALPTPTPAATGNNRGSFISDLDAPQAVPFPEGSVNHSFFPLMGGHALECSSCHTGGDYEGTPATCIGCHANDDPHDGGFGTDCTRCHTVTDWPQVDFDHAFMGSNDCSACHTAPENHYAGACSACHSDTDNFKNAVFNHNTIGGTDCAACHAPPANHFAGACSACHSDTNDFKNATFNHSTIGSQDCSACHSPPANHYEGSCRDCHSDTGNFKNATFNHSTIGNKDCSSCHSPPANHYQGACKNCHTDTNNFKNATFNHSGIGNQDCSACHSPPANHYQGACKNCHTDTNNFKNATFNHSGIGNQDCSACHSPPANHYQGACKNCHTDTNNFKNATFNHSGIGNQDCSACHSPPANHYPGTCRNCHGDTSNFHNVNFSHDGLTDCQSCHTPPQNHFPGQCSDCHDTNSFQGATFDHTFPINHKDANGDCAKCHPGGNTATWTCTACHAQNKMDDKHKEENGYNGNNCTDCHANGKKP